jgi:hypothetical protein
VIGSWLPVTLGDTVRRAESEKAECLVLGDAADLQQAGDAPRALASYARFLPGRPKTPLTDAARSRIGVLCGQPEVGKLATDSESKDFGREEVTRTVGGPTAVLTLYNDSTEPLRIVFSGPARSRRSPPAQPVQSGLNLAASAATKPPPNASSSPQANTTSPSTTPTVQELPAPSPTGPYNPARNTSGCFTIVERPR